MSNYNIIKLKFLSPVHWGRGIGQAYDTSESILHSDTISGALCSGYISLYGDKDVKEFLQSFNISSSFPFDGSTYFLPVPKGFKRFTNTEEGENQNTKAIKRIENIDIDVFSKLQEHQEILFSGKNLSPDGKLLYDGPAPDYDVFKNSMQDRVMIPRSDAGDTIPYHLERKHFHENCGLYFLFTVQPEYQETFINVLDFIGSQGIGTDKSVGNGQFTFDRDVIQITNPKHESSSYLTLSLFCPTRQEASFIKLNESYFELLKRGGFLAGTSVDRFRHLRKKSIYMFSEGSVLKGPENKGKIIDLKPDWNDEEMHPVYRDGRGFSIPVNL